MSPVSLIDLFLPIFIGMGPIKVLLVYMALTRDVKPELQRKVAQKTIRTATIIAIVLLLAGALLMRLLHFTPGALMIAGGLILLILALSMVLGPAGKKEEAGPMSEEMLMSKAIYPLAIPLLLNPVGIVALTVFSAEAQSLVQYGVLVVMVLVVAAIDLGVFLVAHRIDTYLSDERILVSEKLLGIFLAALAVQLIINGLVDLHVITTAVH